MRICAVILLFFLSFMSTAKSDKLSDANFLDRVVAEVNDDVITASELDEQFDILYKQLLAKKASLPDNKTLRKQILGHLIDVELQLQLAKNNNINIDSTELNNAIQKIAASNHITLPRMQEEIAKQGLTWEIYRDNVRKEILMARIQQKAVGSDLVVSNQEVEDYLKSSKHNRKAQQTYHVKNIIIPLPEEPTSDQVKQAQEKVQSLLEKLKNGNDFSQLAIAESSGEFALEGGDLGERHLAELPKIFADKVVDMQVGEVAGPFRTGNGYQLIKLDGVGGQSQRHLVTKTHVRHILLKQDAKMTESEAKTQINNLYQQLKSGKDFALMARQYSLDAASAVKGGDLGWVTKDELVPQFSKVMHELPVHQISEPVKTPFGWHIIEVLERKTVDDTNAYEHQQVHQFLYQRKFREAVENWLQHMRADAYVNIVDKELA